MPKRIVNGSAIDVYFANIGARARQDHLSTSAAVEVRKLSRPDLLIEVELMALIPER